MIEVQYQDPDSESREADLSYSGISGLLQSDKTKGLSFIAKLVADSNILAHQIAELEKELRKASSEFNRRKSGIQLALKHLQISNTVRIVTSDFHVLVELDGSFHEDISEIVFIKGDVNPYDIVVNLNAKGGEG